MRLLLSVEIHSHHNFSENHEFSRMDWRLYRFYIDGNLITEREWIWENGIFLTESVWIEIDQSHHTLEVRPIFNTKDTCEFYIQNFKINSPAGRNCLDQYTQQDLTISFKCNKYTIPKENPYEDFRNYTTSKYKRNH